MSGILLLVVYGFRKVVFCFPKLSLDAIYTGVGAISKDSQKNIPSRIVIFSHIVNELVLLVGVFGGNFYLDRKSFHARLSKFLSPTV